MGKFKNRIYKFMYGRYGYDALSKTLLWVYAGVLLVHMILSLFIDSPFLYLANMLVSFSLVGYILFRTMSRNIPKRREENAKFLGFWRLRRNKRRDRKTHVYRKCPKCKAVLRLPKAKGKHTVSCPRCKERFEVRG